MRKQTSEIAEFLKEPTLRCQMRLRVRDAYKGAITESYVLKYIKREEDDEDFLVLDVSSLFPHVALTYPMPIGKSQYVWCRVTIMTGCKLS